MASEAAAETAAPRGGWLRAAWGGLLSLVMPGLGQIYARAWRLGVGLIAASLVLSAVLHGLTYAAAPTPPAVFLAFVGVCAEVVLRLGAAVDAVRRLRRPPDRGRPRRVHSAWLAAPVAFALAFGVNAALAPRWASFWVASSSQSPTLLVGDLFLADVRVTGAVPSYSDIVLFVLPSRPSVTYVERVIGLPGDTVRLTGGGLHINGAPISRLEAGEFTLEDGGVRLRQKRYMEVLPGGREHFILKATDAGPANNTGEYVVPADHVFVMGDNRDNSADSRLPVPHGVGFVPVRLLIGKAVAIYWSRDRSRILSRIM